LLEALNHLALVIAVALVARAWRRWREPRRNQSFWAPKDGYLDSVRNERERAFLVDGLICAQRALGAAAE
jgi:hypothetical protein